MKQQTVQKHVYFLELSSGNCVRLRFDNLGNGRPVDYDIDWMRTESMEDVREYHGLRRKILADLNHLGFTFKSMSDATDGRVSARVLTT